MPAAAEEAANVEQNYCANNDDESTPNQNKKAKAVEEIPNSAKTVVETQKETESKVKEFLQLLVDYFSNVEQTSGSEKVAELTDSFASLVAKNYPNNFVAFLSIVVENGSMPAYLAAVKYAQEAMTVEVANEFLSYLANHFLRYIDNCRSSRAFDQFCRYFLEFAAVFPQVESTDFVSSFIVPDTVLLDHKLRMAILSVPLVRALQAPADGIHFAQTKRSLAEFAQKCEDVRLLAKLLDLIFTLDGVSVTTKMPNEALMDLTQEVIKHLEPKAVSGGFFPHLSSRTRKANDLPFGAARVYNLRGGRRSTELISSPFNPQDCRSLGILISNKLHTLTDMYLHFLAKTTFLEYNQFLELLLLADQRPSPDLLITLMGLIKVELETVNRLLKDNDNEQDISERLLAYTQVLKVLTPIPFSKQDDLIVRGTNGDDDPTDLSIVLPQFVESARMTRRDFLGIAALIVLRLWNVDIRHCNTYHRYLLEENLTVELGEVINECLNEIAEMSGEDMVVSFKVDIVFQ